jgi:uncharacterized protein YgiM (DUF1202 family)
MGRFRRAPLSVTGVAALLLALAAGALTHASSATAQAAPFSGGATLVVTTDALNLRTTPGLSSSVLDVLPNGESLTVVGGPVDADGTTWYQVASYAVGTQQFDRGWVDAAFVSLVTPVPGGGGPTRIGAASARVSTDGLNVRTGPGLASPVVLTLVQGTSLLLDQRSVVADGYTWYAVQIPDRPSPGWVAGVFVTFDNGTTGGDDGTWNGGSGVGDTAVVDTGSLNCRRGPGLGNGVATILSGGQAVAVLAGPQATDGYHWLQISTADGTPCWVIGEGLAPSPSGGATFATGERVVVTTDLLNLRSGASTSTDVIRTLPTGTALTVTGGSQSADGYTWYPVQTADGTSGWVVGSFLAAA